MTYEQFVEELRQLIAQGEDLRLVSAAGDDAFRTWRHRAESTVIEVQRAGYGVPGGFGSPGRQYRPTWAPVKPSVVRSVFERAMGDSLGELRYIIEQYEKYGPPTNSFQSAQPPPPAVISASTLQGPGANIEPLALPEHVTLRWLFDHVPATTWLYGAGIVLAAFLAGFGVAQTSAGRATVCWVKPDACPAPAAATRPP